jgi:hypothetical protein
MTAMKAFALLSLLLFAASVGAGNRVYSPESPIKFERFGKMPVTYVF